MKSTWKINYSLIDFDTKRIGRLAKETLADWTVRFHAERKMPILTPDDLLELLRLGKEDERSYHQ